MKTLSNDIVLMTVSEAQVLFATWKHQERDELKGKLIVVENAKRGKVMSAFRLADIPDLTELEKVCPCCGGKGKVTLLK